MWWDIKEYKSYGKLSDLLLWDIIYDLDPENEGIIINKDASIQRTYEFRGKDLDAVTNEEMLIAVARLNNVIKRLKGDWAIWAEAQREKTEEYPEKEFPDIISRMFDNQRKNQFRNGNYYETKFYLTLLYLPPKDRYKKVGDIFLDNEEKAVRKALTRDREHFEKFIRESNSFINLFKETMLECRALNNDETLTYLHSCISTRKHKVVCPPFYTPLDNFLYDTPIVGGNNMYMGTRKEEKEGLRILSILNYPPSTVPGILDELNRLNIEYRWVTRFVPLDKLDAKNHIDKIAREWNSSIKSIKTSIKEVISQSESSDINIDAVTKKNDADYAGAEVESEICSYGYHNTYIVLRDRDLSYLERVVSYVRATIEKKGFNVINEDVNAEQAWLGSLPSMARYDPRKFFVSSLNLCHLFPLTTLWAGDKWNNHLKAPALMLCQTGGATPFRFNLHVSDIGNTMIVGPIGSGKSVLLNTIETQCTGYKDAKIFIFDKGGSCRTLTAGVHGEFYDLAGEISTLSFQPLRNINIDREKIWASEWLQMILEQEKMILMPEHKEKIWNALTSMANMPPNQRTLSAFYILLQDQKLKAALMPFINTIPGVVEQDGAYGDLFDNSEDNLTISNWQAFEMGELMHKKGAVMPTLQYLFHVIENNCDGKPTFIFLDECWVFLDNPLFAAKIREWFKTMRKNNVSIIFATQNLSDIANSKIADAIIENCPTRIFLPNATAISDNVTVVYNMFDLNKTERRIIAEATPKRQYYYKSPKGSRLFELGLTDFMLDYVGSASKEEQKEVVRIQQEYPQDDFNLHWLKYKNQNDALKYYLEEKDKEKRAFEGS